MQTQEERQTLAFSGNAQEVCFLAVLCMPALYFTMLEIEL